MSARSVYKAAAGSTHSSAETGGITFNTGAIVAPVGDPICERHASHCDLGAGANQCRKIGAEKHIAPA
jgi:hypothetical protein